MQARHSNAFDRFSCVLKFDRNLMQYTWTLNNWKQLPKIDLFFKSASAFTREMKCYLCWLKNFSLQVKTWFQNRRAKWRRLKQDVSQTDNGKTNSNNTTNNGNTANEDSPSSSRLSIKSKQDGSSSDDVVESTDEDTNAARFENQNGAESETSKSTCNIKPEAQPVVGYTGNGNLPNQSTRYSPVDVDATSGVGSTIELENRIQLSPCYAERQQSVSSPHYGYRISSSTASTSPPYSSLQTPVYNSNGNSMYTPHFTPVVNAVNHPNSQLHQQQSFYQTQQQYNLHPSASFLTTSDSLQPNAHVYQSTPTPFAQPNYTLNNDTTSSSHLLNYTPVQQAMFTDHTGTNSVVSRQKSAQ